MSRDNSETLLAMQHRLSAAGDKDGRKEDPQIFTRTVLKQFMQLHPLVRGVHEDEEEEQTFAEFQDMGRRPPNTQGTGRFVLTPERRTIAVLNLCKRSSLPEERLRRLHAYLRCFLRLEVGQSAASGALSLQTSQRKTDIVDRKQRISFPLRVLRKGRIDCFSLFDVMVEYVSDSDFALLALVDVPLGEREDKDVVEVLGRACGDRVAVVQCYPGVSDVELFGTAAHELLHTMGFDHTTFCRCLMQPSAGSSLFLAPHNLKKLKHFHHADDDDNWCLARFRDLQSQWWSFFDKSSAEARAQLHWLETKIKVLEALDPGDCPAVSSSGPSSSKKSSSRAQSRKRPRSSPGARAST